RQIAGGAEDDEGARIGRLAQGEALGEWVLQLLRHARFFASTRRTRSDRSCCLPSSSRIRPGFNHSYVETYVPNSSCSTYAPSNAARTSPRSSAATQFVNTKFPSQMRDSSFASSVGVSIQCPSLKIVA